MKKYLAAIAATGVLLISAAAAVASTTSASGAGFADTTTGIHLWAPMHEPGGRFASQTEAVAAAHRYDLITILPGQLGTYTAAMRQANPQLRIYVYINGVYLYKSKYGTVPNSVLSRDAAGNLVQSKGWGNYLADPSNAGWISYTQQNCAGVLKQTGADGCYIDMLGTASVTAGYGSGLPINPATGQVWTKLDWLKATSNVASKVAEYTGKPVLGNGFGNGPRYFDSTAPSKVLLAGAVGSTAESWLRSPGAGISSFEPEARWQQEINYLADDNAAGGVALTMTKTWGGGTVAQKAAWRLYSLATFLLGSGSHSYYYFTANVADSATLDDPLYHVAIGSPLGSYSKTGGVYQRWFTNGKVLVNPTTAAVTVPLGGAYRTQTGSLVTSVVVGPNTAEILTAA
jgi:hypothetical protein